MIPLHKSMNLLVPSSIKSASVGYSGRFFLASVTSERSCESRRIGFVFSVIVDIRDNIVTYTYLTFT